MAQGLVKSRPRSTAERQATVAAQHLLYSNSQAPSILTWKALFLLGWPHSDQVIGHLGHARTFLLPLWLPMVTPAEVKSRYRNRALRGAKHLEKRTEPQTPCWPMARHFTLP